MSPESLREETLSFEEAFKSDLFSFGVTLYYLLFEKFPYNLLVNDRQFHMDSQYCLNFEGRSISLELQDLLKKLLEPINKNRLSLNDLIKHKWIINSEKIFEKRECYRDYKKFMEDLNNNNVFV